MASRDKRSNMKVVNAFTLQSMVENQILDGEVIDLVGFESCTLFIKALLYVNGDAEMSVYESDNGVDFTLVDNNFLVQSEQPVLITETNQYVTIGYVGKKRYVRITVATNVNPPVGISVSGTAILEAAHEKPAAVS